MISDLWNLVDSYATPAERPVWALATKDFDKEHQFNQKYLELLPKLVELAAAEGSILYMDESQKLADKLTYKMAQQAKLAAAAGGHVDALKWLEERQPMEYTCMGRKRMANMSVVDLTDVARIWVAGVTHPPVRSWTWKITNKCLESFCKCPERDDESFCKCPEHAIFHRAAISVAALQGNLIALDISSKILGARFPDHQALEMAIIGGNAAAVEWCGALVPANNEFQPGYAISIAVEHNRIDITKLLIEKGYYIPKSTICEKSSDIKTLQYLVDIGCTLTEKTYSAAAAAGNIKTLEWLQERKCPRDMYWAMFSAISSEQYPIVEYFIKTGHGRHALVLIDKVDDPKESLKMIHLCHANDVKMEIAMMVAAAESNQIEAMELMVNLGAPMNAEVCNAALTEEAYEAYLWLRKAGCPQDGQTEELLRSAPERVRKESVAESTAMSVSFMDLTYHVFRRYILRKVNSDSKDRFS